MLLCTFLPGCMCYTVVCAIRNDLYIMTVLAFTYHGSSSISLHNSPQLIIAKSQGDISRVPINSQLQVTKFQLKLAQVKFKGGRRSVLLTEKSRSV